MEWILILSFVFFIGSCKIQAPEYKRLESWQLKSLSIEKVVLTNQIILNNPNKIKGVKLKKLNISFDVDSKRVGVLQQEYNLPIPVNTNFNLPITVQLNTGNSILAALSNIIYGSISEIEVAIKGFAECKYLIFKQTIPIEYRQKIHLEQLLKTNKLN